MVYNIKFKWLVVIHIILILLILALVIKIQIWEEKYDCEDCIVNFEHRRADFVGNASKIKIEMQLEELYESYLNGTCLITWDRTQGFMGASPNFSNE